MYYETINFEEAEESFSLFLFSLTTERIASIFNVSIVGCILFVDILFKAGDGALMLSVRLFKLIELIFNFWISRGRS